MTLMWLFYNVISYSINVQHVFKQVQRYEGASTIYGQHTLQAYVEEFERLADSLCTGKTLPDGPKPRSLLDKEISLQPGVIFDTTYLGKSFGDVMKDVQEFYCPGDTASVTFVSGHPRNNPMASLYFKVKVQAKI